MCYIHSAIQLKIYIINKLKNFEYYFIPFSTLHKIILNDKIELNNSISVGCNRKKFIILKLKKYYKYNQ